MPNFTDNAVMTIKNLFSKNPTIEVQAGDNPESITESYRPRPTANVMRDLNYFFSEATIPKDLKLKGLQSSKAVAGSLQMRLGGKNNYFPPDGSVDFYIDANSLVELRKRDPQSYKIFTSDPSIQDRIPVSFNIEVNNRTPTPVKVREKFDALIKKAQTAASAVIRPDTFPQWMKQDPVLTLQDRLYKDDKLREINQLQENDDIYYALRDRKLQRKK